MTEAISWLREATSLRSSWFSRRKLDRMWLCGSSVGGGGGGGSSCLLDSSRTAMPESELSGVSVVGGKGKTHKKHHYKINA